MAKSKTTKAKRAGTAATPGKGTTSGAALAMDLINTKSTRPDKLPPEARDFLAAILEHNDTAPANNRKVGPERVMVKLGEILGRTVTRYALEKIVRAEFGRAWGHK